MTDVILVDKNDVEIGTGEKLDVHKKGLLHRAFSILIFNSNGELMLQKRADHKYHSGGLWTNTCCSHPEPNEDTLAAAHRRLQEEMGFDTDLEEKFTIVYKAPLDNDLTEHEFLHVFFGEFDQMPKPNPEEAGDWKWISLENLEKDVVENPQNYTFWFKEFLPKVINFKKEEV